MDANHDPNNVDQRPVVVHDNGVQASETEAVSTRRDLTRFLLGAFAAGATGLLLPAADIAIPEAEAAKQNHHRHHRKHKRRRDKPNKHLFTLVEFEIVNRLNRTIPVQFWRFDGTATWSLVKEQAIPRNLDAAHKGSPDELAWIDGRFYVWVRQFPLSFPQLYAGYASSMTEDGPQGKTQVVSELAVLVADRFAVDDAGRRVDIRRRPDSDGYSRFGIDLSII